MDPMTIIAGLGLVGSAITSIAGLIPTKADIERNKRIKELSKLEAGDAFGLTESQRQELQAIGMSPIQAATREQRARAGEMIGLAEIGAGGAILRQEAEQEGIKESTRQLGQAIAQMDREQARVQKAELEDLRARREQQQAFQKQQAIEGAQDILVGASQVAASSQQAKMQGLLQGNERALRNAIAADLQSEGAYTQGPSGQRIFNPLLTDQLKSLGFNASQISMLEGMPQETLREYFLREQVRMPSTTIGFGPESYITASPFTAPTPRGF